MKFSIEDALLLRRRLSFRSFFYNEEHVENIEYFYVLQFIEVLGYNFFHDKILNRVYVIWLLFTVDGTF